MSISIQYKYNGEMYKLTSFFQMTNQLHNKKRKILFGLLLLLIVVPLFVSLGLWQWNKAQRKIQAQASLLSQQNQIVPLAYAINQNQAQDWKYRHVSFSGSYNPDWQIFIDNRYEDGKVGYYVFTPLQLDGSEVRVWVNRGWVAHEQTALQKTEAPSGKWQLSGTVIVPENKYFSLEHKKDREAWKKIWQNPDLNIINQYVPWKVLPILVQLDQSVPTGFSRRWPQFDDRVDKHISYALQWFAFAFASILIWLFCIFKKSNAA